ncbi:MAG: ABC transporter permease, partial [Propionibacteriaceae bacterium]|nr:ABC transporter permease [Propionibacteriaceae bacterium]
MLRYVLKRLMNYIILLFLAVSGTYFLAASSLNARSVYAVQNPPIKPEVLDAMLYRWNLNDKTPLLERYWVWLKGVFTQWDWGYTPRGSWVNDDISIKMWVSLRLLLIGTLAGITIGILIGAWTATRQYKISDRTVTIMSLMVVCTPSFVIGITMQIIAIRINRATGMMIFEFVGESGRYGNYWGAQFFDRLQHLLLPTLALTLMGAAFLSRIQRNLMLDSLGEDYVRTARAKGLPKSKAVMRHALRTALIPTGTYVAFSVATMFTGATYTEKVFSFPGMGAYFVESITRMNVHGVVAVTAFAGICVRVGAVLSDIAVAILDPRVR